MPLRNNHLSGHEQLLRAGRLIAYPAISTVTDALVMNIESWDAGRAIPTVIDFIEMPQFGVWESVHSVPVLMLNAPFRLDMEELPSEGEYGYGLRFTNGGMYTLSNDWNYPFYGERIGSLVERLDRANEMPKPTGRPGKIVSEPVSIPGGVTE